MEFADFGRYLTQQRELRGMSRDDIARVTKIALPMIAALEDGDYERLPGRVFVLNYVRAYAEVIGLSPDEAVLRYEEIDKTIRTSPPPAALERERQKRALLRLLVGLLVLAVAALVIAAATGNLPQPFVTR